jgi:hypothetical protein
MVKVITIGRKVYLINSGLRIMTKFLGRKKNESYFTGSVKRMVDSSSNRFKCSMVSSQND